MNELHKQVREDAETLLDELVLVVMNTAEEIAANHSLEPSSLLRLAIGGRTAAPRKKAVAILIAEREQELLDIHQRGPKDTTTPLKSVDTGKGTASSD